MKKKLMKRVISILLSVAVLCCAAGAEGLLISAENRYDITLTITYPRSGEAPEIPSDFESLSSFLCRSTSPNILFHSEWK